MSHGYGSPLPHELPMLKIATLELDLVRFPPLPPGLSHAFGPLVVTGGSDGLNMSELLWGQVLLAHEESYPVIPKVGWHISIIGLCRLCLGCFFFLGRGLIVLEMLFGEGSPGEGFVQARDGI